MRRRQSALPFVFAAVFCAQASAQAPAVKTVVSWGQTIHDLDAALTATEEFVETAEKATLDGIAPGTVHISIHTAYHAGRILYVRKLQDSRNPANGVK